MRAIGHIHGRGKSIATGWLPDRGRAESETRLSSTCRHHYGLECFRARHFRSRIAIYQTSSTILNGTGAEDYACVMVSGAELRCCLDKTADALVLT